MRWNLLVVLAIFMIVPLSGCLGFGDSNKDEPCEDHVHDDGSTHQHGDCDDQQTGHDDCPDDHDGHDDAMEPEHNDTSDSDPVNATLLRTSMFQEENSTDNQTDPAEPAEPADPHTDLGEVMCPEDPVDPGAVPPVGNDTSEPGAPNELPVPALTMTDGDGNVLGPNSFITPGMNITFSAVGSSDPDGTIDLIGLTVADTNSTRNTQLLQGGNFVDAIYVFDHVGPVNVTLRVLDDRGEGTVLNAMAYVNAQFSASGNIPQNFALDDASSCSPPDDSTGQTLTNDLHWHEVGFSVNAGAKWISADVTGTHDLALCDKSGSLIVAGEAPMIASEEGVYAPGVGYYLVITGSGDYDATVTVHYEPKPAA